MIFRSPRLAAIFGAPAESVTYAQLEALVGEIEAAEAEDLDYKREYKAGVDGSDDAADDIAVDIATFANHRGGVIVVGMAEAQGVPSKAMPIDLTDQLLRRIRTASARVIPTPQFDLIRVANPDADAKVPTGFLLIVVPPSGSAPHAVINPKEDGKLRYPRRNGSGKIWMSESEVASMYRRRFTAAVDQEARLKDIEGDAVYGIEKMQSSAAPSPLLVVSLVPDVPGEFTIDIDVYDRFRQEIYQQTMFVGSTSVGDAPQAAVGHRRLIAYSNGGWRDIRAELHTDGSGALAFALPWEPVDGNEVAQVLDSHVVSYTASALRYLARHARDRTGAAGVAAVSVALLGDADANELVTSRNSPGVALLTPHPLGGTYRVYGADAQKYGRGEAEFLLDDLADDGQPLARATARLVGDLFQAYGAIETLQITRDGALRPRPWGTDWSTGQRWAQQTGIPIDNGTQGGN
ncbi:RNA-binding domain-containing protein [Microtetraspora sp. NBRC 16547]|uniref:AlbA family DNA-binding domain-containing protein n=1 Tax=Microtetraspora sp. NBRC 16547 TaxID=3030993 RepID=UPI0024A23A56|nr:RNA-binding domain-containing protein [Microtetraspora sp. NBRC 16547]GLW97009.1 hypothetical protein Misp02_10960 [Microtetraspora sp. NBRC 16547]